MEIETRAHAKINLHLEVLNRRPDGYHNIFSLMTRVGLSDLLKLRCNLYWRSPVSLEVGLRVTGGSFARVIEKTPAGDNLITRAARIYCERAGLSGGIEVEIEKNIPAGAGLGGGSSDAAAVFTALNDLYRAFSTEELLGLGAGLGADIPFCMTGGAAFCEGIGERISPVKCNLGFAVVIGFDGTHVNTAAAYRGLGRTTESMRTPGYIERKRNELARLCRQDLEIDNFDLLQNDFEPLVVRDNPTIGELKSALLHGGAVHAAMTGSGSAVFGLFTSRERAAESADAVRSRGAWAHTCDFM